VGAGRTRNGLGPFLAAHLEAAGARVVAVSRRDLDRARGAAGDLAVALGHGVEARGSVGELLEDDLDALLVAAPVEAHLPALRAALAARVHVLCEKPLTRVEQTHEGLEIVAGFRAAGLVLMEHCQWPLVLPAWDRLHPGATRRPSSVAMGLSPSGTGRSMLSDSLSHLISVLQALVPVDAATEVAALAFSGRCEAADGLQTSFRLHTPFPAVDCRLELGYCPHPPRPAWIAIEGLRMDREIEVPSYRLSMRAGERMIGIDDPSASLVYRFVRSLREVDSERNGIESDRIRHRARIYRRILRALDGHLG
jgi:predicted dehydrogenase